MNKEVKAKLSKIQDELIKHQEELQLLASDEQDKFDNLSEGLQQSEKGQATEQASADLDEAQTYVQDAIDALQSAVDTIDNVTSA